MNASQAEIYQKLLQEIPDNVSLTKQEQDMLRAIAALWDISPATARVIENGVLVLVNRLSMAQG